MIAERWEGTVSGSWAVSGVSAQCDNVLLAVQSSLNSPCLQLSGSFGKLQEVGPLC